MAMTERGRDLLGTITALVLSVPLMAMGAILAAITTMGDPGCPPTQCSELHVEITVHYWVAVGGCILLPGAVWLGSAIYAFMVNRRGGTGLPIAARGIGLAMVIWLIAFIVRLMLGT